MLSTLDAGCSHGISHYACEDMRFWLTVEEPGPYLVSVADCTPDLSLELLGGRQERARLRSQRRRGVPRHCPRAR